jgi:hypothetical protein
MIIHELLSQCNPDEVINQLREEYPSIEDDSIADYRTMLEGITDIPADKQAEYVIHIKYVDTFLSDDILPPDECYHDLYAYKKGDDVMRYSLAMAPCTVWVSSEVSQQALDEYGPLKILAHMLWEMSFYGYTEETINAFKESLDSTIASIQDDDGETISLEDLLDAIEASSSSSN